MSGALDAGEYRFGEFIFDSADGTLRRNGTVIPVTPKALDLLRVFLANGDRLVSKAELMNQLWPDSFVEESNLAVTIRQLRKALADDAHKPTYIETVARQGYRFIAEIRQSEEPRVLTAASPKQRKVRYLIPLAVVAGLLIASISLGSLYFRSGHSKAAPILSAPFAAEKLSTSGKVFAAALSPDGEKVVYTVRSRSGDAVWLREIDSENNVEILPASDQDYFNFAFSPDGDILYFTRGPRTIDDRADLFSVSIFGGIPRKLVSDTRGWISVSPDGKTISFVRCAFTDKENCSLWTANSADGSNETMIASRPRPLWIVDHEIAPDGKSIVFAAGQSQNAGNNFELMSLDLKSGKERPITPERFFDIKSIEILPDNSGLLLTASRGSTRQFRVWRLDYLDGSIHPLSKDSNSYCDISLDDNGSRLIATQISNDFRLVRANLSDVNRKETLTEQVGLFAFDTNGGIVFQSESTGDMEIWRMNGDGSASRQLTNIEGDDVAPIVSPDGSAIYFCSNRSGEMHIWRMRADGSEQIQLTNADGGMPMFATQDWVYYQHGVDRTLWRVSPDAKEEQVFKTRPFRGPFVFSPSGTRAAFVALRAGRPTAVIISIPDGGEVTSLELEQGEGRFEIAWLRDENAIAYTLSDVKGGNNTLWIQPLDGSPAREAANLGGDKITSFSFAPEENVIAFIQGSWKHDVVMLSGFQ